MIIHNKKQKRIVILFSSGFDSTLALANAVAESDEDTIVSAVSINNSLTIRHQAEREYEGQLLIIRALRKRYPNKTIEYERINIDSTWVVGNRGNASGCLVQPLFWICNILNILPMLQAGDIVQVGYNSEDKAVVYESTLKALWKSALELQNDKDVELQMPLIQKTKSEIVEELFIKYDYLLEYITSCEGYYTTKGQPCSSCGPCHNLQKVLFDLGLSKNKKVSEEALKMLLERFNIVAELDDEEE